MTDTVEKPIPKILTPDLKEWEFPDDDIHIRAIDKKPICYIPVGENVFSIRLLSCRDHKNYLDRYAEYLFRYRKQLSGFEFWRWYESKSDEERSKTVLGMAIKLSKIFGENKQMVKIGLKMVSEYFLEYGKWIPKPKWILTYYFKKIIAHFVNRHRLWKKVETLKDTIDPDILSEIFTRAFEVNKEGFEKKNQSRIQRMLRGLSRLEYQGIIRLLGSQKIDTGKNAI